MSKTNFEKHIKEYSNSIRTLDGIKEAIRQNPGMHIGGTGTKAHINMCREIFQNSVDELIKTKSPCDTIKVIYDARDLNFCVIDNGRGIPHDKIVDIFTKEYTSSNYKKDLYEYSSGTHGIGAKVVYALSDKLIVESNILGNQARAFFDDATLVDVKKGKSTKEFQQGSMISFIPYPGLGEITTNEDDIRGLIMSIIYLTPIGSKIDYTFTDIKGKTKSESIVNHLGIQTILDNYIKNSRLIKDSIPFMYDDGEDRLYFTMNFSTNLDSIPSNLCSFANLTPTILGGTHLDGILDGMTKFFRDYMNKIFLKNSKINVTSQDVKESLVLVINSAHLEPIWGGQAKETVTNPKIQAKFKKWTEELLKESQLVKNQINSIGAHIKKLAELRIKGEKEKINLSKAYQKDALGFPEKLRRAKNKNFELFIVEGDSAASSALNSRDVNSQALYAIRGKLPNAFTTPPAKFLNNAEVAQIIQIIGGGYGKNFSMEKCRADKIIFMSDADADGQHINSLLLSLFIVYLPELIEDGRVFKASPPLYGVKLKNDKFLYLTDEKEEVEYVQKMFMKKHQVTYTNGGKPINKNDLFSYIYNHTGYLETVNEISNRYSIPPQLLEHICYGRVKNIPMKKVLDLLKKTYPKEYRFTELKKQNGIETFCSLVNGQVINFMLIDVILNELKEIETFIRLQDINYLTVDGIPTTTYNFLDYFKRTYPDLQRYKGLGEMNSYQLSESTLNIESRTLVQYNSTNINQEVQRMRYLNDNKHELINEIKF